MKFSIIGEKLKKAVEVAGKISPKKVILNILDYFLLEAEKNFIKILSTNLETGVFYKTLAKIDREGSICVNKRMLENIVFSIENEKPVEVILENSVLHIKTEDNDFKIKGLSTEDFPIIPQPKENEGIFIDANLFCQGLRKVYLFPSSSFSKPEISGVLIQLSENGIRFTGTDSFRLGEKTILLKTNIPEERSIILPQPSTKEIFQIFHNTQGEVKISFSQNQFFIEMPSFDGSFSEIIFTSRIIEGEYPNYYEIIPKKFETKAKFNTDDFVKKVKTAGFFSSKINDVRFSFLPKEQKIEIFSQNPDLGEYKTYMPAEIEGKELTISFNYKFLLDGLLSLEGKEATFHLTSQDGPAMLKQLNHDEFFYLLMPIKMS